MKGKRNISKGPLNFLTNSEKQATSCSYNVSLGDQAESKYNDYIITVTLRTMSLKINAD